MGLTERREEYESAPLGPEDVDPDPFVQWQRWYDDALACEVAEPAAMVVATVDAMGCPDARYVLMRGVDADGFVFYTNLHSPKSEQLQGSGDAAVVFGWLELHRQVRARGEVEPATEAEADAYWASRPRGSQVGAWASPQSRVLPDREVLDRRVAQTEERFADVDVPRPAFWGGWRLRPREIEFWQGRRSRLHDRLRYVAEPGRGWVIQRLAP